MPQKEHLTFESKTPAFLRRLRGEVPSDFQGSSSDPDRHATPQVRARRSRDPADVDDDPVYIDGETGQTLAQAEFDEMKKGSDPSSEPIKEQSAVGSDEKSEDVAREKAAAKATVHVGAIRRKREIPLVVGDELENAEQGEPVEKGDSTLSANGKIASTSSKVKKKAKKIKLSFDDDEG